MRLSILSAAIRLGHLIVDRIAMLNVRQWRKEASARTEQKVADAGVVELASSALHSIAYELGNSFDSLSRSTTVLSYW